MKITFFAILLAFGSAYADDLSPSVYYVSKIDLENTKCVRDRNIVDAQGSVLAKVCKDEYKKCVIEGSCLISNEEKSFLVNYIEMAKGIPRFKKLEDDKCPYGLGVSQICLDPFYSVAADLRYHKPGDVLYIDKLKGVKLPNNETHSGYVIVRDRGGAIKGPNRFDFFTGTLHYQDPTNSISQIGFSSTRNSYPYKIITGSKAEEVRKQRNFPYIPKLGK